jgi:hypothetical protein
MTVQGFNDLSKHLAEMGERLGGRKVNAIWSSILAKAIEPVLFQAQAGSPRRTGILRAGIYRAAGRATSRDKQSKYYRGESVIARVTSGLAGRPPRKESTTAFLFKKGKKAGTVGFATRKSFAPVPQAQEFGNVRSKARPYLVPAFKQAIPVAIGELNQLVDDAIQDVFNNREFVAGVKVSKGRSLSYSQTAAGKARTAARRKRKGV